MFHRYFGCCIHNDAFRVIIFDTLEGIVMYLLNHWKQFNHRRIPWFQRPTQSQKILCVFTPPPTIYFIVSQSFLYGYLQTEAGNRWGLWKCNQLYFFSLPSFFHCTLVSLLWVCRPWWSRHLPVILLHLFINNRWNHLTVAHKMRLYGIIVGHKMFAMGNAAFYLITVEGNRLTKVRNFSEAIKTLVFFMHMQVI